MNVETITAIKNEPHLVDFLCFPETDIEDSGLRRIIPAIRPNTYDYVIWSHSAQGEKTAFICAKKVLRPYKSSNIRTGRFFPYEFSRIKNEEENNYFKTWLDDQEQRRQIKRAMYYTYQESFSLDKKIRASFSRDVTASWNTYAKGKECILFATYGSIIFLIIEALFPERVKTLKDIEVLHYQGIRVTKNSCVLLK